MNQAGTLTKNNKKKKLNPITPSTILIYIILILWAATTLFPFVWIINNSFKASNLVISDSFSPLTTVVYRYDKYGQIMHEQVMQDEHGRDMYDALLTDDAGNPVYEKDIKVPTISSEKNFLGGLALMPTTEVDDEILELQAYDKVNGKILYDESSPQIKLSPTIANYENAFTNPNVRILNGYKNSLIVSGTVMVAVMIFATMMAFALTRYTFRGRSLVHSLVVAALMFPAFSTIVPVYRMITNMGLFNKLPSVMLVQTAGNLAFACTVMIGFVKGLPYELEEAAFIEGAGVARIFTNVIIPLCKPALATVAIFTFIWSYNDLFVQMVLLRAKALMPVCAILREISSQYGTDFGLMAAAVAIVVAPVLVVYILLQKNIIKGLTAGAVKG